MDNRLPIPASPEVSLTFSERLSCNYKRVTGVAVAALGCYLIGDSLKTLLYDTFAGNIDNENGLDVVLAIPKYALGWVALGVGFNRIAENNPKELLKNKETDAIIAKFKGN